MPYGKRTLIVEGMSSARVDRVCLIQRELRSKRERKRRKKPTTELSLLFIYVLLCTTHQTAVA